MCYCDDVLLLLKSEIHGLERFSYRKESAISMHIHSDKLQTFFSVTCIGLSCNIKLIFLQFRK